MKKKIAIFLVLAVFGAFVSFEYFNDCGACIGESDYKFLDEVRTAFANTEGAVKVSDIHPGDWKEVCVYSGGYDANLSYDMFSKTRKIVINSGDPFLTDAYNESAIVFSFGMNEDGIEVIEVFQMTPDVLTYSSPLEDCYTRDEAFLKAVRRRGAEHKGDAAASNPKTIRAIKLVSGKEI